MEKCLKRSSHYLCPFKFSFSSDMHSRKLTSVNEALQNVSLSTLSPLTRVCEDTPLLQVLWRRDDNEMCCILTRVYRLRSLAPHPPCPIRRDIWIPHGVTSGSFSAGLRTMRNSETYRWWCFSRIHIERSRMLWEVVYCPSIVLSPRVYKPQEV